jgi:glutamate-1-semialdehyde 2,1-aminomutase
VAVAAGLATLRLVQVPGFFDRLTQATRSLVDGLVRAAADAGLGFSADSVGGMFGVFFANRAPKTFAEVMASDRTAFNQFFHAMLNAGVYFAPSAFEAGFVSAAHGPAEIEQTVAAASRVFIEMKAPH